MSDIYEFSPVPAYLIPRIREHEPRRLSRPTAIS